MGLKLHKTDEVILLAYFTFQMRIIYGELQAEDKTKLNIDK